MHESRCEGKEMDIYSRWGLQDWKVGWGWEQEGLDLGRVEEESIWRNNLNLETSLG